jgi:hypothetical protein
LSVSRELNCLLIDLASERDNTPSWFLSNDSKLGTPVEPVEPDIPVAAESAALGDLPDGAVSSVAASSDAAIAPPDNAHPTNSAKSFFIKTSL